MEIMYSRRIFSLLIFAIVLLPKAQEGVAIPEVLVNGKKREVFLYTPLHIVPAVEEIREVTESYFFEAISDEVSRYTHWKLLRTEGIIDENSKDISRQISELCMHNGANYAIIPKITFFKVGFGKYIFSSQVIVTLLVYNSDGEYCISVSYDTFKKKGRLFGSAEHSIRKGVKGAFRQLSKRIKN